MTTLTITRPANTTQYTAGDVIASSTTASTAIAALPTFNPGKASILHSITMSKPNTNVTNAAFRVWIINSAPVLTNGDNGALAGMTVAQVVAQFACVFGSGDVYFSAGTLMDMHDALARKAIGGSSADEYLFTPRKNIIFPQMHWLVLEARDTYTPASGEVFSFRLNLQPAD